MGETASLSKSTSWCRCSPRACITESLTSTASSSTRERRLERSLAWARERGIAARGEIGDPNPTSAIEDELRDFGADEVLVVTHPRERQTWQERGELERLQRELDVPVTHIVAGEGEHGDDPRRPSMTDERSEGTVASTRVEAIVGFLDGAGIAYELVEHESVTSAAAEARVARLPPEKVAKTDRVARRQRVRHRGDPAAIGST